ncbi:MAG: hypothetical protein GWM98_00975, partial [Nitrospinaceae bacterium]|nr:hypothetical protein [Nitrospinaceae bacterium]NIY13548.1 hypothetical protein [Nitrospinaceae bacterium]
MKPMYWILLLLLLAGCAHPISQGLRSQADPELSLQQIIQSPNTYIGKKIVLGGV